LKYAIRWGAAYGLAGMIKGLGIGTNINHLWTAAEDRKSFEARQLKVRRLRSTPCQKSRCELDTWQERLGHERATTVHGKLIYSSILRYATRLFTGSL